MTAPTLTQRQPAAPVWIRANYHGIATAGRAYCKVGQVPLSVRWHHLAWESEARRRKEGRWRDIKRIARELDKLAKASGVTLSQVIAVALAEGGADV